MGSGIGLCYSSNTQNNYLSNRLIIPYFINTQGEIKRPEHLIAWWKHRIFLYLGPNEKDRLELRWLCRLFRDSLQPPPLWTFFPREVDEKYNTLIEMLDHLNCKHVAARCKYYRGIGIDHRDCSSSEIREGDTVIAKCVGWTKYYEGEVTRVNCDDTYDIKFEDGESKKGVEKDKIRTRVTLIPGLTQPCTIDDTRPLLILDAARELSKLPRCIFLTKGTYHGQCNKYGHRVGGGLNISFPIVIIGESRNNYNLYDRTFNGFSKLNYLKHIPVKTVITNVGNHLRQQLARRPENNFTQSEIVKTFWNETRMSLQEFLCNNPDKYTFDTAVCVVLKGSGY